MDYQKSTRAVCSLNFKQLGVALQNYHAAHACFPPFHFVDVHGRPTHSWRAILLPFMEHPQVAARYDINHPWNSPANREAVSASVSTLICPSIGDEPLSRTCYIAIPGPGRFFDGKVTVTESEISDGLANTIVAVELPRSTVLWADPLDGQPRGGMRVENYLEYIRQAAAPHVNVLWADGSVTRLPKGIDAKSFEALLTIAGGEPIDRQSLWQ